MTENDKNVNVREETKDELGQNFMNIMTFGIWGAVVPSEKVTVVEDKDGNKVEFDNKDDAYSYANKISKD